MARAVRGASGMVTTLPPAGNRQGPVPALQAQVLDISTGGLRNPGRLAGSCCPFVLAARRLRASLRPHDVSPHEQLGDRLYPGGERGDLNWGRDL
jgi:hypothetical protein